MKRANVSDVARIAGVSTATVSRVLNEPDRVREATREKVLKAIDELNFVKSATAFSFKVQHTHNILVLVANIGNIYYSEVFHGLHQKAEAHGYNIILATPDKGKVSRQITDRLHSGRVDGVVVLDGFDLRNADFERLRQIYGGMPPIVGFAEKAGFLRYPHVYIDNRKAAFDATRHLLDKGHVRIGHVTGPEGYPVTGERLGGYQDALRAAGITPDPDLVFPAGFYSEKGRHAVRRLMERERAGWPTALFCSNDEAAMGVISEFDRHGISVPRDMSVIGFDDISTADAYVPALTTISQPRSLIGEGAMSLLLEVMENPDTSGSRVIELDVHLIERESVGLPNPARTPAPAV